MAVRLGLEATQALGKRGHEVILVDASRTLGGRVSREGPVARPRGVDPGRRLPSRTDRAALERRGGPRRRRCFYRALEAAGLPHIRFHDLQHTFGTIAVQAVTLTEVKAFMGHADIQTTMIYVHHVPQHDAADRLSQLLEERTADASGCTPGVREPDSEEAEEAERADLQALSDAGGGTRTPDTRIMIPPRGFPASADVRRFPCRLAVLSDDRRARSAAVFGPRVA